MHTCCPTFGSRRALQPALRAEFGLHALRSPSPYFLVADLNKAGAPSTGAAPPGAPPQRQRSSEELCTRSREAAGRAAVGGTCWISSVPAGSTEQRSCAWQRWALLKPSLEELFVLQTPSDLAQPSCGVFGAVSQRRATSWCFRWPCRQLRSVTAGLAWQLQPREMCSGFTFQRCRVLAHQMAGSSSIRVFFHLVNPLISQRRCL